MSGNLGRTTLRRRRRAADPMRAYDSLPQPLRRWLAEACLPWSPASCRRIWLKARAEGASLEGALARLDRAERRMLERARKALPHQFPENLQGTLASSGPLQSVTTRETVPSRRHVARALH